MPRVNPGRPIRRKKAGRPDQEKRFSKALNMEIIVEDKRGLTKLRRTVIALLDKAMAGDVPAIKEVAERLDGKMPQAIVNDNDEPLTFVTRIELVAPDFGHEVRRAIERPIEQLIEDAVVLENGNSFAGDFAGEVGAPAQEPNNDGDKSPEVGGEKLPLPMFRRSRGFT